MRILGYILVVLFVTTSAFGQQINPVPDYIFRNQMSVGRNAPTDTAAYLSVGPRYGANKGLMPPMVVDTNAVTGVKRNGLLIFSVQLNNFAYWDSTTSRFRKITAEAVVDSVVFATRAWRKKGDDSLGAVISQRTDTALISTRAYRQKGVDSLVTLISTLGGGTVLSVSAGTGMNFTTITTSGSVNADTNVLATRANRDKLKDSLQANIAGKVNISDTATMLSAYLRKADTTSMLSPYLRKTDTTAMLTPYVRNAGFGLTKGTQALSVDSALMATRARVQKGIDSVASLVTTTDSVLFSTRAWRQKGVDSVAALANTKATATGTTNYLSKFTGTSSLGNSIVYATTSEVGISTPSPTHPLDVNGRVRVRTIDSTATGMNMLYADVDGVVKKAAPPAGGTVTSVSAGTGMSFTTITSTGSVSADTVALATRAWRQKGIDSLANVRVGGSGTTNYVPKFTASGTIGNSQIFDNGTSVGVSTASPVSKFEVQLGYITSGNQSSTSGSKILGGAWSGSQHLTTFGSDRSSGGPVIGYATWPSPTTSQNFVSAAGIDIARSAYFVGGSEHRWYFGASQNRAVDSSLSMTERMRLTAAGELLIGTTSDAGNFQLQVADGIYAGGNSNDVAIQIEPGRSIRNEGTGYVDYATSGSGDLFFRGISGTPTATFLGNGRTIFNGVTDAGYQVDVNGTLRSVNGAYLASSSGEILLGMADVGNYKVQIGGPIYFQNGANTGLTTSAGLHFMAKGDNTYFTGFNFQGVAASDMFFGRTASSDDLVISTSNTGSPSERIRFAQAGNVGIGTGASPSERLDVNGRARVRTIDSSASPINMLWADNNGVIKKTAVPASVVGSGNTNYIPKWTNATALGNSVMYEQGGEITVGSTTDYGAFTLQVDGTQYVKTSLAVGSTSPAAQFHSLTSTGTAVTLGDGTSNLAIIQGASRTGTTAVSGSFANTLVLASHDDAIAANTGASIGFHAKWNSGLYNSSAQFASIFGGKENSTDANLAGYLGFNTRPAGGNPTERMRLTSAGELLVSTTTDVGDFKLQVSGNQYVSGLGAFGTTSLLADADVQIGATSGNDGYLQIAAASNGIAQLSFGDGSGNDRFAGYMQYYHSGDSLVMGTASAPRFNLNATGLGLGTAPAERLDVNGRARVRTIDSSGSPINMLWADNNGVIRKAAVPAGGGGGVTSVATGFGIDGGTITSTGTLTADTVEMATRARVQKGIDSVGALARVTGSGTTNYVPLWTGSTALGNSSIYEASTEVLIGTTSDAGAFKLQISGVTYSSDGFRTGNPNGGTAATWKLGSRIAGSYSTASAYLEVDIGGTLYYIGLVTPD